MQFARGSLGVWGAGADASQLPSRQGTRDAPAALGGFSKLGSRPPSPSGRRREDEPAVCGLQGTPGRCRGGARAAGLSIPAQLPSGVRAQCDLLGPGPADPGVRGGGLGPAAVLALPCALGRWGQEPRGGGDVGTASQVSSQSLGWPRPTVTQPGVRGCTVKGRRVSPGPCRVAGGEQVLPEWGSGAPARLPHVRAPPTTLGSESPSWGPRACQTRCPALTGRAGLEDFQGAGAPAQAWPPLPYPRRPPRPGNCVTWKR